VIIDSIICVAVITRRFFARAILIMRFCKPGTAARRMHQLARQVHVIAAARERYRQVVRLDQRGGLDVFLVLVGQRRRGQAAALAVEPLVVRQHAAAHHPANDLMAFDFDDIEFEHAVIEQQHRTLADIPGQVFVIQPDAFLVTQSVQRGIEDENVTLVQDDLVVLEFSHTDLRALQVGQDADSAPHYRRSRTYRFGTLHMILHRAMREIHPYQVDAGANHLLQHFLVAGSGPQRCDYFGSTQHNGHLQLQPPPQPSVSFCARCSSISTAGNFLPSRNSRKAPPAVEI